MAHKCAVNWTGSSGTMETDICLDMSCDIDTYSKSKVYIQEIVLDDDFIMRAHCCPKDHEDGLPDGLSEPQFLVDPSQCTKCMTRPIYNMVTNPLVKEPGRPKYIDACSVKKYSV